MIDKEKAIWIYNKLFSIRYFEEKIKQIAKDKSVPGYLHTYIGSEGIAVGVMAALEHDDWITSTYRNHGHAIAKNVSLKEITAEIYGRKNGICKGRGGSMHISDFDKGMLGSFGIVAAGPPVAIGAALQEKLNKGKKITASFFGDGAIHNGAFHEAAGISKLWKLPILFVCENNGYAEATATEWHLNTDNLRDITKAYNMHSVYGDGMDVFDVFKKTTEAINFVKENSEPVFLEFKSYRFSGQYEGDNQLYQSPDEIKKEKKRDPIVLASKNFSKFLSEQEFIELKKNAREEVEVAFEYAELQDWPLPEDTLNDVYVNYPIDLIKCEN